MRFVFLTSRFYPFGDANGICVKNAADELIRRGHEVTVICEGDGGRDDVDGIETVFIKPTLIRRAENYKDDKGSLLFEYLFKLFNIIRKIIITLAFVWKYPDVSPIRAHKIYNTLKKIATTKKTDYIIGSFAPYDCVEAVNLFKKKNKDIKTVITYFDLIDGRNPFGSAFSDICKKLCFKSEKKTFMLNDVILIPGNAKEKYESEKYCFAKDKIHFFEFPLFVSDSKPETNLKKERNNDFEILYAGSVDGNNRSASYFLQLAEILKKQHGVNIKVRFYGGFTDREVYSEYKDSDFVEFCGKIGADRVYELMCKADCLLNLSNAVTYNMVPSKIFQMFSSCNRIINMIANENDAAIEYFDKYPARLNIKEYEKNAERDVHLLKDFIENSNIEPPDFDNIRDIYIRNTPERFVDLIMSE